jgi:tetratricopeptide (TPR) repeat protein
LEKNLLDSALACFTEALGIFEKRGEKRQAANEFNNIGYVYLKKHQWHRAIEYLERSLEIGEKLGDKRLQAVVYDNLGDAFKGRGEREKAIEFYERSLRLSENLGDRQQSADAYKHLGQVYPDRKKALIYLEKALQLYTQLGIEREINFVKRLLEEHKKG